MVVFLSRPAEPRALRSCCYPGGPERTPETVLGSARRVLGRPETPTREDVRMTHEQIHHANEVCPNPGPFAHEKLSDTADAGHPEPQAAEVESARILANQARATLRSQGFTDEQIRQLADEYIACDLGEDVDGFVAWARAHSRL
jgi:hypothetical protein